MDERQRHRLYQEVRDCNGLLKCEALILTHDQLRAGALAFIMICGQCFAVMGLEVFTDAPKYHRGKGLGFAACALSAMLIPVFMLFINHLNKEKDKNQLSLEAAEKRRLGVEEIGDDHPDFRYWL